jgi:hypothetical protein
MKKLSVAFVGMLAMVSLAQAGWWIMGIYECLRFNGRHNRK